MAATIVNPPIGPADIDRVFAKRSNLASSALGTRILACSDDFFASVHNLINPEPPIHRPGVFVETGAWYDGWETRRHNPDEYDWAVVKLGAAGVVHGVEIDTAFFTGNFGEHVLIEAVPLASLSALGPDPDATVARPDFAGWQPLLPKSACGPSQRRAWRLPTPSSPIAYSRVRMYPDGGFARLRLYGRVVPPSPPQSSGDQQQQQPPLEELSSALRGGIALSASDQHYTPASNTLLPGRGLNMGDGWETARSRGADHVDWVVVRLGLRGTIERVLVDTLHFRGNFPRAVRVHGLDVGAPKGDAEEEDEDPAWDDPRWTEVVRGDQPTCKDTEHVFDGMLLVAPAGSAVFSHVKLTLVPDGGIKRFRVFGRRV